MWLRWPFTASMLRLVTISMATETKLHRVWNWVKGLYAVRDTESDDRSMPSDESPAILKLRANFENREAIYLEKGALRVRVSNIRGSVARRIVWAKVEEVQTPGLGVGMFDRRTRNETTPCAWKIGAGYLTGFSDHCWKMGYGGWSLHFNPKVVEAVLELASRWPDDMDTSERYNQIVRLVQYDPKFRDANWQEVFSGGCRDRGMIGL